MLVDSLVRENENEYLLVKEVGEKQPSTFVRVIIPINK